ncbi:MAG: hypothetical protein EHM45_00205 [Desulfobacteraceae bacterium]|nr:MAG: hypothetical protein EHM45_00205 [Desulfobacteraceae bacterium]
MKKGMTHKWTLTVSFWFIILLLTIYNTSKLNQLRASLDEIETLRLDQQFWQRHSKELESLVIEGQHLYLTVDSADMGFLIIEHNLKIITTQLGLPPVTLTKQPGNESDGELPLGISMTGNVENTFHFLKSAEKEMPFLKAKNLKITVDPLTRKTVLEAFFIFKYRTESGSVEPINPGGA